MKLTTFLVLTLLSFSLNAAGKTAYINSKELLEQSPQASAVKAKMQEQFGARENELRNLLKSIQEMEQTYQNDNAIMSAEQKQKAQDNIAQNKRRFQFEQQALKQDFQTRQRELLREMEGEIRAVIQAYGEQQGYDYIFTDASVAYVNEANDITAKILEELKK